ncbi:MAG TPA: HAD-IA family hydrolase [Puia sp.]
MIKTVLFDVDGVLLDSFEANLRFYQNLLIKAGYTSPTEKDFLPLMHFPLVKVVKSLTHASDKEAERIYLLAKEFGEELYPHNLLKTPEYAYKIIKELNNLYKLGVVTSRIKDGIYTVPQLKRMQKYFQIAVGFEDTKNHKPDPDPLVFAAQKLQIKPEEVVYIGDAESDFLAAKAARMKFILFGETNFLSTDNHVKSFKNLPEIITNL